MNREIKFRCFHKLKNKMYSTEEINHLHLSAFKTHVNCEFMQYTGLKDKNGKEIYEGDIVQFATERQCGVKIFKSDVNFEDGAFVIREGVDYYDTYLGAMTNNENMLEVIGNIYENPELMGEK